MIVSNDAILSAPPYHIDSSILNSLIDIAEKVGRIDAQFLGKSSPELRKQNRIKTIHSSLRIEGNTLSSEQVTALLEDKRVIGPKRDIQEVTNAISVYDSLKTLDSKSEKDFLKAHKILMNGLIAEPGEYRKGSSGIAKGDQIAHIAPPAQMVPVQMKDLFSYLKLNEDHNLIKAAVFHYELEFIHPFSDGNGRMGRLWNTRILMDSYPIFEFIPFETVISQNQEDYYNALSESDKKGESGAFIRFMLEVLSKSLDPFLEMKEIKLSALQRIELYLESGVTQFSRSDYLKFFKNISSATASRDLALAVSEKKIKKKGDKRLTIYTSSPRTQ